MTENVAGNTEQSNNLDGLLQMLAINRQKNQKDSHQQNWSSCASLERALHTSISGEMAFAEKDRLIKKKEAPC